MTNKLAIAIKLELNQTGPKDIVMYYGLRFKHPQVMKRMDLPDDAMYSNNDNPEQTDIYCHRDLARI